jgi:hypothetical protein
MKTSTILSLSFDREKTRRRHEVLRQNGFTVVSVGSPTQARYEIEMGQCGVFITCPLVADVVSVDLLALFKKFCPSGIAIAVTNSGTSPSVAQQADIVVDETNDPEGLADALLAQLNSPSNRGAGAA